MSLKDDPRFAHIKFTTRLQMIEDAMVLCEEVLDPTGDNYDPAKAVDFIGTARVRIAELKAEVGAGRRWSGSVR